MEEKKPKPKQNGKRGRRTKAEMAAEENMRIWNQVCVTKSEWLGKPRPDGLSQVKQQIQRKRATELFGPFGIGWGVVPGSEDVQVLDMNHGQKQVIYRATMFYTIKTEATAKTENSDAVDGKIERGEITIGSNILVYPGSTFEFMKSVMTDALTKGLAGLGFSSDVFEGAFNEQDSTAETVAVTDSVIGKEEVKELETLLDSANASREKFMGYLEKKGFSSIASITRSHYSDIINQVRERAIEVLAAKQIKENLVKEAENAGKK